MTIASHVFLLLFLPFLIIIYYGVFKHPRHKMIVLLVASYIFYAFADLRFLPLLLSLSFLTYWLAKRKWIGIGIALNLIALLVFKYWGFGIETFNAFMNGWGLGDMANILQWGLPLGISFYVFKHIGYLLDIQRNRYLPTDDFWAFATFSAYFPQISAGPISDFQETTSQFTELPTKPKDNQTYIGLLFISIGLAKKVLIADTLGAFLATPMNTVDGFIGLLPAWYLVVAFTMQLYFDFSGYTDMVLGISTLFGIKLPQNFNSPYLAKNPAEFWERWHISLSNWFNYYLFSPLSRSLLRKWGASKRDQAQYVANLSVMTLVGLWHGAGWSFILWGAYHGLLLNFNAWWKRQNKSFPAWVARPLFILSLMVGWALFMSPNFEYLKYLFLQMFGFGGWGDATVVLGLIKDIATPALLVALVLSALGLSEAVSILNATQNQNSWHVFLWGVLAALSLLFLGEQIQFLYVQF